MELLQLNLKVKIKKSKLKSGPGVGFLLFNFAFYPIQWPDLPVQQFINTNGRLSLARPVFSM